MATQVCMGAMMCCSFGMAPSSLVVLPKNKVLGMTPAANIMDNVPNVNILPFGTCSSMSNPVVAAATAAAMGALTPMTCTPVTAAPWAPGVPTVLVGGMPALDMNSKLMCNWGGVIQITSPGQFVINDA